MGGCAGCLNSPHSSMQLLLRWGEHGGMQAVHPPEKLRIQALQPSRMCMLALAVLVSGACFVGGASSTKLRLTGCYARKQQEHDALATQRRRCIKYKVTYVGLPGEVLHSPEAAAVMVQDRAAASNGLLMCPGRGLARRSVTLTF